MPRHISFENVEPHKRNAEADGGNAGKKQEAGGKKRKKRKKLPPLEDHLNKLRNALNKAIRLSKSSYSEGLTKKMHVYKKMLKKTREDPSGSHAALSMIKHDLNKLAAAGLVKFELLEPFMRLLEKPLPSDLGSKDPKSSSDDDLTIKIPKKHVTGPSAPRVDAAYVHKPTAAPVAEPKAVEPAAAQRSEEEENPSKECGHRGECKCSHRGRPRRQRKQVLEPGKRYLVSLKHHAGKDNKVSRLLKCGPRQLALTGVGRATLSFIVKEKGRKSVTGTILRDEVDVEPITGVSEPSGLSPQLLLEMHWKGDPQWYDVRYTPGQDGQQAVTLISEVRLFDFDEDEDDWRWPQYPSFFHDDKVIILDMDRVATITDVGADDDHTYICEWDDKKKGEPRNFEIDVWYTRVRGVLAADVSEEAALSEEEDDDDADYEVGDEVLYKNRTWEVTNVEEKDDDIVYNLENREPPDMFIVNSCEITQNELNADWIPNFDIDDDIMYNGLAGTIYDIDYDEQAYEVRMDSGDLCTRAENELSLLQQLSLGEGSVVFYNYGFYKIVSNRVTYTLKPEEGDGPEVEGVTQHDLDDWVLYVSAGKWQIYHIEKPFDGQMRNVTRTVQGKKVKVKKLHYKVRGEDGKSKWILYDPKKFKDQSDAHSYFEDAMNDDDDLDVVVSFGIGERVSVIIDSNTTEVGEIVSHIPGAEVDDEKYEVRIGAGVHVFEVGQIVGREVEDEEEDVSVGDRETDENGICWEVKRLEAGRAVWEVFTVEDVEEDTDDSDDSDDDVVPESDFRVDDYVTIDEEGAVYQITKAFNNVYDVIPVWGMDGTKISGLSVDDLTLYEPTFSVGDHVLFEGAKCKVTEVEDDGHYTLDNGEHVTENVTENELEKFFETLTGVVRVNGTKEVFKVIKYKDGEYELQNVVDGSEIKADKDMVDLKESCEFKKGEYVQLCSERYPRKVKSVNKTKYTYKLEGLPEREFRESELAEDQSKPKFNEGDTVRIGSGGKVFTIKKVIREEGSYILNDGSKHHEDVLEEVEDEDED